MEPVHRDVAPRAPALVAYAILGSHQPFSHQRSFEERRANAQSQESDVVSQVPCPLQKFMSRQSPERATLATAANTRDQTQAIVPRAHRHPDERLPEEAARADYISFT